MVLFTSLPEQIYTDTHTHTHTHRHVHTQTHATLPLKGTGDVLPK